MQGLMRRQAPECRAGSRIQQRRRPAGVLARRSIRCQAAATDYEALSGATVLRVNTGEPVELLSLWEAEPGAKAVIPFMTHFGDLSSWELAQKLARIIPILETSGVKVVAVGIGSVAAGQEFARTLKFPTDKLFADPDASVYRALGFSPGFLPGVEVSAYAKLVPMLMGIGSPGTIQEVLRGYLGDKDAKPVFDSPTPFDILGSGYQRPFELATLRLFNMIGILPKWSDLTPANEQLLLQQGGCLAFEGTTTIFRHDDSGILKYVDVDQLLRVVLSAEEVPGATITTTLATELPQQRAGVSVGSDSSM